MIFKFVDCLYILQVKLMDGIWNIVQQTRLFLCKVYYLFRPAKTIIQPLLQKT